MCPGRVWCALKVTFPKIEPALERDFAQMRGNVQRAFEDHANVSALLQICFYTDALSRFRDGTTEEFPNDGGKVFQDFVRDYFPRFRAAAGLLGQFNICTDRGRRTVESVDAYRALYRLWRDGVVHEQLAEPTSYLTRASDAGPRDYLTLEPNRWGVMDRHGHFTKSFNVRLDPLVDDFVEAVEAFERDLLNPIGSRTLRRNCVARYRFLLR